MARRASYEGEVGCGATVFFTLESGSRVGVVAPSRPSSIRTNTHADEDVAVIGV